jgi:diguanylate cyclase (GGDEF)-like protein
MFRTKTTKIISVTVLFVFLLLFGLFIINAIEKKERAYYLQTQSKLLQNKYTVLHKYLKIMSHDIYSMYENNPRLIKLLTLATQQSGDALDETRKKVYKLLIKNYRRLEHMGISQVHFHLPNNYSFLRMYAPDRYGDNLSPLRKSVIITNKTLKPTEGMEACPYLLGYRFVYPLFDHNKKHIGSVEISYSTKMIFKNLIEDFVYDDHFLISKKVANNTIVGKEYGYNYKDTWESPDYYIEELTHKKLKDRLFYQDLNNPKLKKLLREKFKTGEAFAVAVQYNYQQIVLNFLPLASADQKKNIAYIVTYKVSNYLSREAVQAKYTSLLFVAIMILLYIFVIYILLNREKLKELALYDPLTALPNRTLFNIEFQDEINRAKRYDYKLALMFIDLDGFKAVNDTFGHHIGDELLRKVAKILKSSIRTVDLAARLSGDEFTIVLSHAKSPKEVLQVAQHILEKINKEIIIQGHTIKVGASIGVAIYPNDATNIDQLLKTADKNMYEAKQNGKNQIIYKPKEKH